MSVRRSVGWELRWSATRFEEWGAGSGRSPAPSLTAVCGELPPAASPPRSPEPRLAEHLWAIPLRDAVRDAGGITPEDLIGFGMDLGDQSELEADNQQ